MATDGDIFNEPRQPGVAFKTEREYLEAPHDEVPMPNLPGVPEQEFNPALAPVLRISVTWDQRPLMEAINEAVNSNDINKVLHVFNNARIEAKQIGKLGVRAVCLPPK